MVEQVYSGAFEQAMSPRACAVIALGYCVLVHARLCSVQCILPGSKWAKMQDQVQLRVEHCTVSGSCSSVDCVGDGRKLDGGNIG